jgi:hypothetical protein
MNINHIYEALTSPTPPQHLLAAGSPLALASSLTLLVRIEEMPLLGLSYTAEELQEKFPHDVVPLCAKKVFKNELSRYRAWRRMLYDIFLLETGSFADHDVISGFIRIARLQYKVRTSENLRILRRVLPQGMEIKDLTFSNAIQIDKTLTNVTRPNFRNALYLLDRLQDAPLAARSRHLLPEGTIGLLPPPSGHLYHAPLPPQLHEVYSEAPPRLHAAMPFVYRLCLITGILSSDQDPSLDEFAKKCEALWYVDPHNYGFSKPSKVALKSYIRNIRNHTVSGHTPPARIQAATPLAWSDLRSLMRQHGLEKLIQRTFGVSGPAIKEDVAPTKITPAWIQEKLRDLPRQQRNAFRSGIFVLDELIEDATFPNDILPREVSGLKRERDPTR